MQLPSVQLDVVSEDTIERFIANRNPQPGEVQIPIDASIDFDLFGAATGLAVQVNDVDVYTGGTWANGWTGAIAAGPDANTTRIRLQNPGAFGDGERVRIDVTASGSRFTTWSFFAYDTMPPLIQEVAAINDRQLRVRFNENVTMDDAAELGDAFNPLSYKLERSTRPAVTPAITRVDRVSDSEVLLTTEFECSFGAGYMLVVTGVADEFGNVFLPPNNVLRFTGWLPPYPSRRRWLLHDFMPRVAMSVDYQDELKLFLGCLQDTNNVLLYSIDKWIEIIDPDTAPEQFVDAMLLDLGNPFPFELTLTMKRKLAKLLVSIYQLKGTAIGIIDVVRLFTGVEVTIETFPGRGWRIGYHQLNRKGQHASPNPAVIGPGQRALYSFRIRTTALLTSEQRAIIRAIGIYMKGAQEHLVGIIDASPQPEDLIWLIIGKTRINYSKLSGKSATKSILSFQLSD